MKKRLLLFLCVLIFIINGCGYTPKTNALSGNSGITAHSSDPAIKKTGFYTGVQSNPDISGIKSKKQLKNIARKQYPMFTSPAPALDAALGLFVDSATKKLISNYESVVRISELLCMPPELIGSVVFKEQLTRSAPDFAVVIATLFDKSDTHTVGLGAVSVRGAKNAYNWYITNKHRLRNRGDIEAAAKKYDILFRDDSCLLGALWTDDDFNLFITGMILMSVASNIGFDINGFGHYSDEQTRRVLYGYNNRKGFTYARLVMEYFGDTRIILQKQS